MDVRNWQKCVISSKDEMESFFIAIGYPIKIDQLAKVLDMSSNYVAQKVKEFGLVGYVNFGSGSSGELELANFIREIYHGEIRVNDREAIRPLEIDIYLPELKLGIEYDGLYWHSEINKGKEYHKNKTIKARDMGIKLVHIFEYEWKNVARMDRVKKYLVSLVSGRRQYTGNYEISEIDNDVAYRFCEVNNILGGTKASVSLAIMSGGDIVSVMMFSRPRFSKDYDWEIVRLCSLPGLEIPNGYRDMLRYFLVTRTPKSLLAYCDMTKFDGSDYTKMGMKLSGFTDPGYVWFGKNGKTLSRYETMKKKLLEMGLGQYGNTEAEIMENLGYIRIYDCGYMKFTV